jgi:nucleotide-binding universal stress UspA family protein
MKIYKHILLPIDLSDSRSVIEDAAILAGRYHAQLSLLYVIERFPEDLPVDKIGPENVDPQSHLIHQAEEKINNAISKIDYKNINYEIVVSKFAAVREILQYAESHHIDLIVINSKGESAVSRVVGAPSFNVVQNAKCDVLVSRSD